MGSEVYNDGTLKVLKLTALSELSEVHAIRNEVFVVEQKVDADEEYEFEAESTHFLAILEGKPAATGRWRYTEKGIKIERMAVLKKFRLKGLASLILKAILDDVKGISSTKYLHSQESAVPLYLKNSFKIKGDRFTEANILHYYMEYVQNEPTKLV